MLEKFMGFVFGKKKSPMILQITVIVHSKPDDSKTFVKFVKLKRNLKNIFSLISKLSDFNVHTLKVLSQL